MNAPASHAALAAPVSRLVSLSALVPSGTHIQALRRQRFDKKLLDELADSVRQVGVLQPLVVRPRGEKGFEIVAGERRFIAARKAGLAEIPAAVSELTDDQVVEVQLIENLQREGLHELEEAEGYDELMKLKKVNADAVAEMVGRSKGYVYARVKLLALCPEARKAFYAGEMDASKALLIARIGHHDTQREAMKVITKGRWAGDGPMNYRDAHKYVVEHFMLRLKSAPFDTKDERLVPKAGSCTACPKRTGNQRDLFGDVKDADTCTDPVCYDAKRQAHYAAAIKKLEAQGKKVVAGDAAKKIFRGWNSANEWERERLGGGYQKLNDTTYVGYNSKKVSEVVGAEYEPVLVQHPGTGEIVKVATPAAIQSGVQKLKRSAKGKSKSRPASSATSHGSYAAKRDLDEKVAKRAVELLAEKYHGPIGKPELLGLAKRDLGYGNYDEDWFRTLFKLPTTGRIEQHLAKLSEKEIGRLLVLSEVAQELCAGYGRPEVAQPLCKRFKVDLKKIRKEITEQEKAAAKAKAGEKPKGKAKAKKK